MILDHVYNDESDERKSPKAISPLFRVYFRDMAFVDFLSSLS